MLVCVWVVGGAILSYFIVKDEHFSRGHPPSDAIHQDVQQAVYKAQFQYDLNWGRWKDKL